eukprot:5130745-Prymnesium_polylepis.1
MRATVGTRTTSDAHTPQATFLSFCRSVFLAAATVKEEAKAAEGGGPGGRRPSLAAMAAEELAQATQRWRWWSGAA